jgi:hypothetical protein
MSMCGGRGLNVWSGAHSNHGMPPTAPAALGARVCVCAVKVEEKMVWTQQ